MALAAVGAVGDRRVRRGRLGAGAVRARHDARDARARPHAAARSRRWPTSPPAEARVLERRRRAHGRRRRTCRSARVIVVRPGERMPLDGVVESAATSSVDQRADHRRVACRSTRRPATRVFAGTLNQFGALDVRTTRDRPRLDARAHRRAGRAGAGAAARLASASSTASPRIYTPLVFARRARCWRSSRRSLGGDAGHWLYRALALLIVACPCSLVISIPVAVVSADRRAPRAAAS